MNTRYVVLSVSAIEEAPFSIPGRLVKVLESRPSSIPRVFTLTILVEVEIEGTTK
jgi:hypothetical protein